MSSNNEYQVHKEDALPDGYGKLTSIVTDPAPYEAPAAYPYRLQVKPGGGPAIYDKSGILVSTVEINNVPPGSFDFIIDDAAGRHYNQTRQIGVLIDGQVVYDKLVVDYQSLIPKPQ